MKHASVFLNQQPRHGIVQGDQIVVAEAFHRYEMLYLYPLSGDVGHLRRLCLDLELRCAEDQPLAAD